MKAREFFNNIITKEGNIALATCVDNQPNVRIVTFTYDPNSQGCLYFTTFVGNAKINEFQQNQKVSFIVVPDSLTDDAEAQVRANGIVQKSTRPIAEVAAMIAKKVPDFTSVLEGAGDALMVYEIHFKNAQVTIGMDPAETITL